MADHRIAEVADLIGISVSMLRTWSLELAAYLSDGAQWRAPAGGQRPAPRYSDGDIVLLCRVQRLREQGRSFDQIRDLLDERAEQAGDPPAPGPPPDLARPPAANAYERALDALHDALHMQGALIQGLQEETRHLRSAHDQLAAAHSTQRSHYLAIIRLLVARDLKRVRRRPAEV